MNAYILLILMVLVVLVCLLFALLFSYYFLLKRIAVSHPKYYETLGSPFLPIANRSILKTIRRDSSNYHLLGELLAGRPKNFPNDIRLTRLARQVRFEMFSIILLALVGGGFAFGI